MDSLKWNVLVRAIENGTITKTAEELGYTVSGISKIISSLEQELGVVLVTRSKTGITMTQECEILMPYIKQMLTASDSFAQMLNELKGIHCGKVRVGTSYQSYFKKLVAVIAAFTKQYPDIHIELIEGTSSTLYDMLRKRELDMCIVSERDRMDRFVKIGQDEIMVWMSADRKEAAPKNFPVKNIEDATYIDIYPDQETDNSLLIQKLGLSVNSKYTASEIYAALAMVEADLGIALINKLLAEEIGGKALTVPLEPRQYINYGLVESAELSPAASRFKKYLVDAINHSEQETENIVTGRNEV